jgi:uncharacterized circularly permuted ATP-grasp superfamily protein
MSFENYLTEGFYDELFERDGRPRAYASSLISRLTQFSTADLVSRQKSAESTLRRLGITFGSRDEKNAEHIFPFDIIPRLIDSKTWKRISKGVAQRVQAVNAFINDIYSKQLILKDGVIPRDIVLSSPGYTAVCLGIKPKKGIWTQISGIDLVRDADGRFYVLEDNMRCPSGVSYVVENRRVLKCTFPGLFESLDVEPVDDYPERLLQTMQSTSPVDPEDTVAVILTPGVYNSAYYEHSFLAKSMGIPLVEGSDLFVANKLVYMKTTRGPRQVHVVYRRIDDDFLDPQVFRPDSMLGVPGIFEAWRSGNVTLVNAPGTGLGDDKAIYAFVPKMIRYYLNEEPILESVPTWLCAYEADRNHVLENLDKLVVKCVHQSGGYGMLIGPRSDDEERARFRELILKDPRSYIAQPTLSLSRVPTLLDSHFEGRHVDLRPFVLYGDEIYVQPGGLTRVAMKRGSLVVNSSQGGGSKDTWVIRN